MCDLISDSRIGQEPTAMASQTDHVQALAPNDVTDIIFLYGGMK